MAAICASANSAEPRTSNERGRAAMAELRDLAGTLCAAHGATITVGPSGQRGLCAKGCKTEALLEYARSLNGHVPRGGDQPGVSDASDNESPAAEERVSSGRAKQRPPVDEAGGLGTEKSGASENGNNEYGKRDGRGQVAPVDSWKLVLYSRTQDQLEKTTKEHPIALDMLKADTLENFIGYVNGQRNIPSDPLTRDPELTPIEIDEEIQVIARALREGYQVPAVSNGHALVELPAIAWEDFGGALIANEEYLKRTAVIDKLGYTSSVMLITGGKHAGKSTLARWMAICVAKGWPFLGREVKQGPVFYVASEDETMAARQELIRLGWTHEDPIRFLPASKIGDNPERFLDQLAIEVKRHGAVLVILDMLFDFVRIPDEMSYAGTREALGKIQMLASLGECLVATTHHAPKYLETTDAAVTALGSQGLAARVSPILLVRKHGPGLHSIVSTTIRDPRGEAIPESKLVRNVDGSVTLGGGFKLWMQAEVFMPKVLELLETEPGQELTASDVKEALGISYQLASGSLSKLYKEHKIGRTGEGKKGKPFRYSADAPDSSVANGKDPHPDSSQGYTPDENGNPDDGRYGYKG
jgi:hypothetical protein